LLHQAGVSSLIIVQASPEKSHILSCDPVFLGVRHMYLIRPNKRRPFFPPVVAQESGSRLISKVLHHFSVQRGGHFSTY